MFKLRILYTLSLIFVLFYHCYPQSNYLITVRNINAINNNRYEFEVWIKSVSSFFILTSYQCSFKIYPVNFNDNGLSFTYLNNTSQLTSMPPTYSVGVRRLDNELNLTFASKPGSEIITTTAKRIGKFRINNGSSFGDEPLVLQWNFENVMRTILTGSPFINITQPLQHQYDNENLIIQMNPGWNFISIPFRLNDMSINKLFPNVAPIVYSYSNNGYVKTDTLECGKGYYIKLSSQETVNLNGSTANPVIDVESGWNLIGPLQFNISTSNISTSPQGIIVSNFFGFQTEYQAAQALKIGQAYWVNIGQNGKLNLSGSSPGSMFKNMINETLIDEAVKNMSQIIINDAEGHNFILYAAAGSEDLELFSLPPAPPDGVFDIRFTTQRFAENLESSKAIRLNGAAYPVVIKAVGMNLRIQDGINGSFINTAIKDGESFEIHNSSLKILEVRKINVIPGEYILEQNYPNPFNPETTIRFSIPEAGDIKLTIYNPLGQKVAELANTTLEAGSYSFQWNASGFSSGIYFYELNTKKFSSVKKMMLVK